MNAEDRLILCRKFEELRKLSVWQLVMLAAIAVGIGVQVPMPV